LYLSIPGEEKESVYELDNTSVKCPWCQDDINVTPLNVVTLTTSREEREKLLAGEFDHFPCPTCSRDVPYSNPIVCNDVANQVLIYYFPHPLPDDVRETVQSSLVEAREEISIEGLSTPVNEDWNICVAFGREELEAMMAGRLDVENCI
jgi:endogenous inhibitor of DNA gyrase (YacG/DUF329 family)